MNVKFIEREQIIARLKGGDFSVSINDYRDAIKNMEIAELLSFVEGESDITSLELADSNIGDSDIDILLGFLDTHPELTYLDTVVKLQEKFDASQSNKSQEHRVTFIKSHS